MSEHVQSPPRYVGGRGRPDLRHREGAPGRVGADAEGHPAPPPRRSPDGLRAGHAGSDRGNGLDMTVELRTCTECGEEKPVGEFPLTGVAKASGKRYRARSCKDCRKAYKREHHKMNDGSTRLATSGASAWLATRGSGARPIPDRPKRHQARDARVKGDRARHRRAGNRWIQTAPAPTKVARCRIHRPRGGSRTGSGASAVPLADFLAALLHAARRDDRGAAVEVASSCAGRARSSR